MAEYSILNWLRTDKPTKRNGKNPVFFRIRVKGKETKVSTGIDVAIKDWDKKQNIPKSKPVLLQLNKAKNDIELYINRWLADGKELTIGTVKDFCSRKKKASDAEHQSFFDYYRDFIERKRKEEVSDSTIRGYLSTYKVLKEYKEQVNISDISLSFIEQFDEYLIEVRKNAPGGRYLRHQNLRSVIQDMIKHNIHVDNPYNFFKIPHGKVKEVYLTKEELSSIYQLYAKMSRITDVSKILQMFLFSCYCGLRYSDIINLKWSDIDYKHKVIRTEMQKTRHQVITPLVGKAETIAFIRLRSKSARLSTGQDNVFQKFSLNKCNKVLAEVEKELKIDKHITFHVARHTFATLLVQDGVSIYDVSKYLGHKSINMTQRYLKYDQSMAETAAKKITTFNSL